MMASALGAIAIHAILVAECEGHKVKDYSSLGIGPPFNITRIDNVHENRFITVADVTIDRHGERGLYTIIERADTVLMFVRDKVGDRVLLLEQHRFPSNMRSLELPMGAIEAGETPYEAACRELMEETGLTIRSHDPVASFYPSAGLSAQRIHVLSVVVDELAIDNTIEEEEILERCVYPISSLASLVDDGRICEGFSLASLTVLKSKRPDLFDF